MPLARRARGVTGRLVRGREAPAACAAARASSYTLTLGTVRGPQYPSMEGSRDGRCPAVRVRPLTRVRALVLAADPHQLGVFGVPGGEPGECAGAEAVGPASADGRRAHAGPTGDVLDRHGPMTALVERLSGRVQDRASMLSMRGRQVAGDDGTFTGPAATKIDPVRWAPHRHQRPVAPGPRRGRDHCRARPVVHVPEDSSGHVGPWRRRCW